VRQFYTDDWPDEEGQPQFFLMDNIRWGETEAYACQQARRPEELVKLELSAGAVLLIHHGGIEEFPTVPAALRRMTEIIEEEEQKPLLTTHPEERKSPC